MNVYLIKASAPGPFKDYKKAMGSPPQNIFSVAACTPDNVKITLVDETIGMKPSFCIKADIVGIFFHTPDALHAYKMADKYRKKGFTVIGGGLHPTFMYEEAKSHFDSILIGEAEGVWEELLHDKANGRLKPFYKRESQLDLKYLNPYPTNLIKPAKYDYLWSVIVTRGCVHRCDFCTVPGFFNKKYTMRPIENIVDEIKNAPEGCWFELHSDNLTASRDYALSLFNTLEPLGVNWFGEATIAMADDAELLNAAARSGCKNLLLGIETPSQAALNKSGKGFVNPDDIKDKIGKFHDYEISILSSMIFGFDTHTSDIFQESVEFCDYIEIDEVEGVILIPFAGTPLYNRLKTEGRILTDDWSKYDGNNVVYQPAMMSSDELYEGYLWFWEQLKHKSPSK
jgi:radical SAM superfamily enzyme YgiQ (UPF0313 family)